MNINKILFYISAIVASGAMLLLALNVFHYETAFGSKLNVGLLLTWVAALLVAISQFLEWKRKHQTE